MVPTFPRRSRPWLLTKAARGGLGSAPDRRTRRAHLHLRYSCAPPFGPAELVTQDPLRKKCRGSTPALHLVPTRGFCPDAPQHFLRNGLRSRHVRLSTETLFVPVFTEGQQGACLAGHGRGRRTAHKYTKPSFGDPGLSAQSTTPSMSVAGGGLAECEVALMRAGYPERP